MCEVKHFPELEPTPFAEIRTWMESSCLQLRHVENCQQSGLVKMEDTVEIRAVYPSLVRQLLKKKKQIQIYLVLTDKSQACWCLLQATQVPG